MKAGRAEAVAAGDTPRPVPILAGWLAQIARPRGGGASGSRRRYGIRDVANEEVAEVEALLVAVAVDAGALEWGNSAADMSPRRSL